MFCMRSFCAYALAAFAHYASFLLVDLSRKFYGGGMTYCVFLFREFIKYRISGFCRNTRSIPCTVRVKMQLFMTLRLLRRGGYD